MSGHRKGEPYFVPRTLIELPHPIAYYCNRLLPDLENWRTQARGRGGDKSDCCEKFLHHILPYFVEVLVQDGIYFVKEFPTHPMSTMLKVRF
jgi:hypothetical protein